MSVLLWLSWSLGAYLLGSVSPGDLVCRARGFDIRRLGDGNPGAHNVWRQVGRREAALVLALDVGSGALATVPPYALDAPAWARATATVAVLLGHIFPAFWSFRGGVGGAVAIGTSAGLLPAGALIAGAVTAGMLIATRTALYSVWLYFAVCLVVGFAIHRELAAVLTVLLSVAIPTARWVTRYEVRSAADVRRWIEDGRG